MRTPTDPAVERGLVAAQSVMARVRRRVESFARQYPRADAGVLIAKLRAELGNSEPILAASLQHGILAAWIAGARGPAQDAAPRVSKPPDLTPPQSPWLVAGDDPGRTVRFPAVEAAVRDLIARDVMTKDDYVTLSEDASAAARAVARVVSADAVGAVRDAVARDLTQGGGLLGFTKTVGPLLTGAGLGDHDVEAVYRTQTGLARSAGLRAVLDHPLVGPEFPYMKWAATMDGRVRPDHLAMQTAGINGTDIFRTDDPLLRMVWPPAGYNCRCVVIPTSIEVAADAGIWEAKEWLRTGEPPARPAWVSWVPITLPKGWPQSRGRIIPIFGA